MRRIKHYIGVFIYRALELFNGEVFKWCRFLPYKYIERMKVWVLGLIDIED